MSKQLRKAQTRERTNRRWLKISHKQKQLSDVSASERKFVFAIFLFLYLGFAKCFRVSQ